MNPRPRFLFALLCAVILFTSNTASADKVRAEDPGDDIELNNRQSQYQGQNQYQHQDQEQEQSQDQANSQNTTITSNYKRPSNAYVGSGNSTASEQKVRAISGGWLTGGMSLRWDMTDKDARILRVAGDMRDRGQMSAADKLECSIKPIYEALGGSPGACHTMLAGSATAVDHKVYRRSDVDRDLELMALQQELEQLKQNQVSQSQMAECRESKDRCTSEYINELKKQ